MAKEPKKLEELFHDTLKDIYFSSPAGHSISSEGSKIPLASMVKRVLTSLYTRDRGIHWSTALTPPQGAPAGCSKWSVKEETRDGSKTTVKREDFTTD